MNTQAPMQRALGDQWARLPAILQRHFQSAAHRDVGMLDIEYPRFMQAPLYLLDWLGALLRRGGTAVPTTVEKHMDGERQHWRRTLYFPDGHEARFDSVWTYAGGNRIIEYVNPFLGLCMAVQTDGECLSYEGVYFIFRVGPWQLRIPEGLLLGHTSIRERPLHDGAFAMDFRLTHPWLGQVYRYAGIFRTTLEE